MSVVFPKAKLISLLNSATKSRSPEPVTVELFWEPLHCLEIPMIATRFEPHSIKSKESLENSRKSSSQTGLQRPIRMGKCYLKGELGDQINVILLADAYNLRKWIRLRFDPFFVLFLKNLYFCISQHLRLTNPYLRQTFSF